MIKINGKNYEKQAAPRFVALTNSGTALDEQGRVWRHLTVFHGEPPEETAGWFLDEEPALVQVK